MWSLLRISARMKQQSPVFIVGESRSGTSLLYRLLQQHPSFRPRRINLVETHILDQLRRTFMFRRGYPKTLTRFMLGDADAYEAFVRSIRVPRAVSALSAPLNLLVRDRVGWLWQANMGPLVLRSYFFHAMGARGCARLVEKTPTNTVHLDKLSAAFPKARLLYIHRHPVDVFSSYRRRALADPAADWAHLDVGDFCRRYEASTARVLAWSAKGHENIRRVRYEQFTRDVAAEFAAICTFLAEPFDRSAVEERHENPARWWGDPHLWGPVVASTKRWDEYMTPAEAFEIQRRLASVMGELDYEPYLHRSPSP